jgi:pyruvate kinase
MMDRIVCEAEAHFLEWGKPTDVVEIMDPDDAASMARAARALANDKNVAAVACFTMRGQSAWLISKIRPRVPILAFTPEPETFGRLAFLWGVRPQLVPYVNSVEEMLRHVDAALTTTVRPGDQVVVICGFPVGAMRLPNMALLHTVGAMKPSLGCAGPSEVWRGSPTAVSSRPAPGKAASNAARIKSGVIVRANSQPKRTSTG